MLSKFLQLPLLLLVRSAADAIAAFATIISSEAALLSALSGVVLLLLASRLAHSNF
jgi:hypothetical protein